MFSPPPELLVFRPPNAPGADPLCHPLLLSKVEIQLQAEPEHNRVRIESLCRLTGKTGVEMEALTAASVAALTIYDMCKAVQKDMVIGPVRLLAKSGGKSGILRWMRMIKVLFFAQFASLQELMRWIFQQIFPPLSRCDSIWRQRAIVGRWRWKTASCWRRSTRRW